MANSAVPGQMLLSLGSDLGLHGLIRPVSPNTKGKYKNYMYLPKKKKKKKKN